VVPQTTTFSTTATTSTFQAPPTQPTSLHPKTGTKGRAIGLGFGLGIPFVVLALFFYYRYRRISIPVKTTAPEPPPAYPDGGGGFVLETVVGQVIGEGNGNRAKDEEGGKASRVVGYK